ncbi:FlgO family outer membrane protein [Noviherbaspirillum sp. CPCC 100848]|uniref:FlgO family outer membrane protein n=1 Tax=Noviherbaspirillum album TaxID=3080276 RepID=A0ABU6J3K5_9BURK|nr:FlgO family outer membrane protein [Noviherbaspirillum sp. CPCC 100848]MEC4718205.1 FlgO family outer membrane protein [Noviherbaspirillum sp. CPCC 100848]
MKKILLAAAVGAALTGCVTIPDATCTTSVGEVGYSLADSLHKSIGKEDREKTVLLGSIVNLDDVNEVSPLGRLVGEQLGSRLAQHRVKIAEPKIRNVVVSSKSGEHSVSREAKEIATRSNAYAFVTGTVTKMQGRYYFNAKMIRVSDSQVLATADVCLTGKIREAGL